MLISIFGILRVGKIYCSVIYGILRRTVVSDEATIRDFESPSGEFCEHAGAIQIKRAMVVLC